jgi:hypothetical protein
VRVDDTDLAGLPEDVRAAFLAFRATPTARNWSLLSQLFVGANQVLDALKQLDSTFEDAYPLDGADLVALPDELAWPRIPEPATVLRALKA